MSVRKTRSTQVITKPKTMSRSVFHFYVRTDLLPWRTLPSISQANTNELRYVMGLYQTSQKLRDVVVSKVRFVSAQQWPSAVAICVNRARCH